MSNHISKLSAKSLFKCRSARLCNTAKIWRILVIFSTFFLFVISSLFIPIGFSVSGHAQTQPVFSKPVNLSHDSANATYPIVQSVGSNVYVAWTEKTGGVLFRASYDGGQTWSPPLTSRAMQVSQGQGITQYPVMFANQSDVFLAWSQVVGSTGVQMFEATSLNNGLNFTVTQITYGNASHSYITPAITAVGRDVYLVYSDNGPIDWKNSYVVSSNDYGLPGSWSTPFHYAETFEPQIAAFGKNVYAIATGIQFAVSHNNGSTWTKILNQTFRGDEPMIAAYGKYVYAATQAKSNRSVIHFLVSPDNGNHFREITTLSKQMNDSWAPMIAAYNNSVWVAFRNYPGSSKGQIWLYTSFNNGVNWSNPISLSGIGVKGSAETYPYTVATTDGQNVFVVWSQRVTTTYWILRVSYSADGGSTWTSAPGIDVSQNKHGEAGFETDIATGSMSSYGSHCYASWEFVNGSSTPSQIYFSYS